MLHPRELGKGFWEARAEGRWWETAACDGMDRAMKSSTYLLLPIRVLALEGLPGWSGVSFVASQSGPVLSLVIGIGVDKQTWQSVPKFFGS